MSKDRYIYEIGLDVCSRYTSSDDANVVMSEETGSMHGKEESLVILVVLA